MHREISGEMIASLPDEELLKAYERSWHPWNGPKPIQEWTLDELDRAADFCDRIVHELQRRGLTRA